MSGSFGWQPTLAADDFAYIQRLIKGNQVLEVSGLDGHCKVEGWYCSSLTFGQTLALMFERNGEER